MTLTGTNLTGAAIVKFGGTDALSLTVVDDTTVRAVTPAHDEGEVDVELTTLAGTAILTGGYTYAETTVGQSAFGGIIACTDGGLQNLIAASADNSTEIVWGGNGTATGATGTTDGDYNTGVIVRALGAGIYAAQLCSDYEVDSLGNSPCVAGNICYNDWFLPAKEQLNCLYTIKVLLVVLPLMGTTGALRRPLRTTRGSSGSSLAIRAQQIRTSIY